MHLESGETRNHYASFRYNKSISCPPSIIIRKRSTNRLKLWSFPWKLVELLISCELQGMGSASARVGQIQCWTQFHSSHSIYHSHHITIIIPLLDVSHSLSHFAHISYLCLIKWIVAPAKCELNEWFKLAFNWCFYMQIFYLLCHLSSVCFPPNVSNISLSLYLCVYLLIIGLSIVLPFFYLRVYRNFLCPYFTQMHTLSTFYLPNDFLFWFCSAIQRTFFQSDFFLLLTVSNWSRYPTNTHHQLSPRNQ